MLEFAPNVRILLVRADNIGDVLLTTPAAASLRKRYPLAFIGYLCRSYTAPLFDGNPAVNQVIAVDDGFPFGVLKSIKDLKFDVSVHFYVEPKGALLAVWAGIPKRIGPLSKIWSALLTEKIVQNRSQVEKHEAEYNLDLAKACGPPGGEAGADGVSAPPVICLSGLEKREGAQILSRVLGVENPRPVVIHPGTKGHVEAWPLRSFLDLAVKIGDRGEKVVFTAGIGEKKIVDEVLNLSHKNVRVIPAGSLNLRQLASVIFQARLFVGNSSGPLHIATAVGVPTISFFPKAPPVTSARRWGPFGNDSLNRVLSPEREQVPLSSISPDAVMLEVDSVSRKV